MKTEAKISDYLKKHCDIIICSVIAFIMCYGEMLFQKIGYHDDIGHFFDIGGTYKLGRWGLGLIESFHKLFFGDSMWSLQVYNGALVILFLGAGVCVLTDFFRIKNRALRYLFVFLFMASPALGCMLCYMFTAPAYSLGALFAILSGAILAEELGLTKEDAKPAKLRALIGLAFGILSLGIYQSYFSFTLILLILGLTVYTTKHPVKDVFKKAGMILACVAIILAGYLVIMKLSLVITGNELSDYKNMDKAFSVRIDEYIERVLNAYKEFIIPSDSKPAMFPLNGRYFYWVLLVLSFVAVFIRTILSKIRNKVITVVLLILFPLAVNFSYLITSDGIYEMMMFGNAAVFGGMIFLSQDLMSSADPDSARSKAILVRTIGTLMTVIMVMLGLIYWRYSNQVCLKAEFVQKEYTSYLTTLATRIQSTPGYHADIKVLLHNTEWIRGVELPEEFESIELPHKTNPLEYNAKNRKRIYKYLQYWCGFTADYTKEKKVSDMDYVENMPHYPDDGSIQIVDDVLVVNF